MLQIGVLGFLTMRVKFVIDIAEDDFSNNKIVSKFKTNWDLY